MDRQSDSWVLYYHYQMNESVTDGRTDNLCDRLTNRRFINIDYSPNKRYFVNDERMGRKIVSKVIIGERKFLEHCNA